MTSKNELKDLEVDVLKILKRLEWRLVYYDEDHDKFHWYIDTCRFTKLTEKEATKIRDWLGMNKSKN